MGKAGTRTTSALIDAADELETECDGHADEARQLAILALHFVARLDPAVFQPAFILERRHERDL